MNNRNISIEIFKLDQPECIDEKVESDLLSTFAKTLNHLGLEAFIGIQERPQGRGPGSDGIWLYKDNVFWLVCQTSRHFTFMPAYFTDLKSAIDFTLIFSGNKPN